MALPEITIRRVNSVNPAGSEVLIDGHRIKGLEGFMWRVETAEADVVTLTIKGHVTVEMIGNPRPGSTD